VSNAVISGLFDKSDISRRRMACVGSNYVYTYSHQKKTEKMMAPDGNEADGTVRIWRNARLATMSPSLPGMGVVENGAVVTQGSRIAFVGRDADLPASTAMSAEVVDCEGRWITPGLIDCHTHLVHAGNRANEFEMRLAGATYEEVARAGGGIVSSVRALRAASEDDLVAETLPRLDALIAEGVTTVEVKSGYGLDLANEVKSLRAARRLAEERPVSVTTTFLGAHALPPEAAGDKDAFIDRVAKDILPAIAVQGLADAVDGFCEGIAFSPEQIERIFQAARAHGLPVKLHADQLSNLGGAELAARYGALSADHLEYTDEVGARAMAKAGTVAVILPGAFYFIRETRKPPVDLFRRHGVAMAVATDCNPGTSPLTSLLLTMNMAATLFGMTVDECLLGVTRHAAAALGLAAETGSLEVGKRADLAIWNIGRPAELVYRMGFNPLHARIRRGK
jgi:imidazolonepropionase